MTKYNIDQVLHKANSFAKKGNNHEARFLLNQIIDHYPNNLRVKEALSKLNITSASNLFNQASIYHSNGNLVKAMDLYQSAISVRTDFPEVYNNLGMIYKTNGDFEKALYYYKKALYYKNNFAQAYYNIGDLLRHLKNWNGAILAFKQSIKYQPKHKNSYFNLANCLKETKKYDEAIKMYKKSILLDSNCFETNFNLATSFYEIADYKNAIEMYEKSISINHSNADCFYYLGNSLVMIDKNDLAIIAYIKALDLDNKKEEVYQNLGFCLINRKIQFPNQKLKNVMIKLLNSNFFNPVELSIPATSLIKKEKVIHQLLCENDFEFLKENIIDIISILSRQTLFLKLMNSSIIPDYELEILLTKIRSAILFKINELEISKELLIFQEALANLCFFNNFIFENDQKTILHVKSLENKINLEFNKGQQPHIHFILCLASFKSLHKYSWAKYISIPSNLKETFKNIFLNTCEEKNIISKLTRSKNIENAISLRVRDQYEYNPYPRWKIIGSHIKPLSIKEIVSQSSLKLIDKKIENISSPKILIAGCGTGQHSLMTAKLFKNSKVTAIDLSLNSLGYAKRKSNEYNQKNINYMQVDLLNLSKLNQTFDIIECSGVLHHMENPFNGLKELVKCLKPGGLMKIGLYSSIAREHIFKVRKEIKKLNLNSENKTIKSFRTKIFVSKLDHHKKLLNSPDFYDLNGVRDLIFHEQEHVFNLLEIKDYLTQLSLKFSGFDNFEINKVFKLSYTNENDVYDLTKWSKIEEKNPNIFSRMYQFWVQKSS